MDGCDPYDCSGKMPAAVSLTDALITLVLFQHAHRFHTGRFGRVGPFRTRIRVRSHRRCTRGTWAAAVRHARGAVQPKDPRGSRGTSHTLPTPVHISISLRKGEEVPAWEETAFLYSPKFAFASYVFFAIRFEKGCHRALRRGRHRRRADRPSRCESAARADRGG
jgi:hypothetical protein